MKAKGKILIGVGVVVGLVVVHALVKAKLGKDKNAGRSIYGWKVYNLIKNGKFTDKMEIKAITKK
tara:strand:- start:72 stop:266 length:195 start_codon:yes stop_codon:yes gene_type:complete